MTMSILVVPGQLRMVFDESNFVFFYVGSIIFPIKVLLFWQ